MPFESVDDIPNCDHLNKRFRAVLSCGFFNGDLKIRGRRHQRKRR